MDDELKALAARAIAWKNWRWMPGMRRIDGVIRHRDDIHNRVHPQRLVDLREFPVMIDELPCAAYSDFHIAMQGLPDLSDIPTLARVEQLACEALGVDYIETRAPVAPDRGDPRGWWSARSYRGHRAGGGEVRGRHLRAACLVAALDAAHEG